ncbi:MAG: tetratricopeptide repeat protein [Chloroflexota bacterium]
MPQVENTVFISYRRTNFYLARSIYDHLRQHDYDVFLDMEKIDSGDFSQQIANSIASRAHFVLILTPSALERCTSPTDWVRKEIEYALDTKRNIIPLTFDEFKFDEIERFLPSHIASRLKMYNALSIPRDYFEEGLTRLRERYLNKSLETVLHPASVQTQTLEKQHKQKADEAPVITEAKIEAEQAYELGTMQGHTGQIRASIGSYTRAIELNPDFADAYNNRGLAHRLLGQYHVAVEDLTKAIEIGHAQRLFWFTYNRGLIYLDMQLFDEAVNDFSETERLVPDDPELFMTLTQRGIAHMGRRDATSAMADFNRAIAINSSYTLAYMKRSTLHQILGNFGAAIEDLSQVVEIEPENEQAHFNRGTVYLNIGNYNAALTDFTRAIELNFHVLYYAYYNRGLCHFFEGDYDKAIADFTETIRLVPDDSELFVTLTKRGIAHASKGDKASARQDFEKALVLNPNYLDAKTHLMTLN